MKKSIAIITMLLFSVTLSAQQAAFVKQLNGNKISTITLKERINQIIDSAKITGLQVAIINNNKTVWTGSFGLKNTEKQLKLDDSTEMYAASLTKTVSAYLTLKLVNEGRFSLDKPLHLYLKKPIATYEKWKDLGNDTAAFNKITARMILSHSSGMPVLRSMYHDKVDLIARPGEKFYYSNEGMNLLGFVLEEYCGKPLDVLAREQVFEPLQMHQTSMIWETPFLRNFSFAYYKNGKIYGSERRDNGRAAGSMTTTATDYAKFVSALLLQKGLPAKLFKEMQTPQIRITSKRGFGPERDSLSHEYNRINLSWGLGTGLFTSPYGKAFFHTGHGEANQNYYVAYPEKGIAVVMLSNSENFESAASSILNACIGDHYSPLEWLGYDAN